eukprot:CAMPEP_0185605654 /NCGR_PEP_ID=MMETSP0436-20130131/4207_1 /TAXON_ID=626734 ORGANISM="Favella taraikaensis, Strain Fe Narragansett Bay" /NCGR_SAMPLE_ID=MMETSP0436 /ASSEMBLY_ACC=CAM_ASM_000390 /LENGTH=92 /DNA_ID=CAMNT_0028236935 /DNA_START=6 /DNA_END=284 /DNA_ORIENTATION=-
MSVAVSNEDAITGANIEVENIYDEIEIDDMDFEEDEQVFYYPCPCGDKFRITLAQLREGNTIATCPSCSLQIRIISDEEFLEDLLAEHGIEL